MTIKLTAVDVTPEERVEYETLSDEDKKAFNELGPIDRIVARKLRKSYAEHLRFREERKGLRHSYDYWETPPGSSRLVDPKTGEIVAT